MLSKIDTPPTLFDCGGTASAGIQTSGTQTGALTINQSRETVVVTLLVKVGAVLLCYINKVESLLEHAVHHMKHSLMYS